MSKPHKIKRYHRSSEIYKARPRLVTIILWIVGLGLLAFVGASVYKPVYEFIMGDRESLFTQEPSSSVAEEEAPPPESEPEPSSEPPPPVLRAAYLPASALEDQDALDALLARLKGQDLNAVMVDIKSADGTVLFATSNRDAAGWDAIAGQAIDLAALSASLGEKEMYLVARMPAFRDQAAANGNRDLAIRYQDGDWLWLDNAAEAGGMPWLNPFSDGARRYIIDLALEATQQGAAMVVLEDVQFPDGSASANATFGADSGAADRAQALRGFVEDCADALAQAGGRLGIYLPATHIAMGNVSQAEAQADPNQVQLTETRYGGNPLNVVGNTLVLGTLPAQFDERFDKGGLQLEAPYADPAAALSACIAYIRDIAPMKEMEIVPLALGGTEADRSLTGEQLQEQLRALEQAGCEAYILYSADGEYPTE